MPRQPNKTAAAVADAEVVDEKALKKAHAALPVLAAQTSEAMKAIGYELAYHRERVVQEAQFYMANSAEAMLQAGKRLVVLKEHEPHGDFVEILETRLGLSPRVAQKMMQASVKFLDTKALSNASTSALLAIGKSKLLELITEDSEDLAQLADGGTLAGMGLDDIERMTVREVRSALREARAEREADKVLLDRKNAKIDDQARQIKRIQKAPPDEVLAQLQKETTSQMHDALGCLRGTLRGAFNALRGHHETVGTGDSDVFMAGIVGQLQHELTAIRNDFGLPDVSAAADQKLAAEVAQWAK
jgi:hypothetical protein